MHDMSADREFTKPSSDFGVVSDVLPLEASAASAMWEQLSGSVERFIDAWESGSGAPSVAEYVMAVPAAHRRLTAVELIKVDLEYRWLKIKQPRYVEEYLKKFPFLASEIPVDLLY